MSTVTSSDRKTLHGDLEVVRTLLGRLAGLLSTLELLLPRRLLLAEGGGLVLELGFSVGDGGVAVLASLEQNAVLLLQSLEFESE